MRFFSPCFFFFLLWLSSVPAWAVGENAQDSASPSAETALNLSWPANEAEKNFLKKELELKAGQRGTRWPDARSGALPGAVIEITPTLSEDDFEALYDVHVWQLADVKAMRENEITPDLAKRLLEFKGPNDDLEKTVCKAIDSQRAKADIFVYYPLFSDCGEWETEARLVGKGNYGEAYQEVEGVLDFVWSGGEQLWRGDRCADPLTALVEAYPPFLQPVAVVGLTYVNLFGEPLATIDLHSKDDNGHMNILVGGEKAGTFTCEPSDLAALRDLFAQCWVCPLFETMYDAMSFFAYDVFVEVREGARNLLAVAFALWLVYTLIVTLGSFEPVDPFEFWNMLAKQGFAVLFAAILLVGAKPAWIFDNTIGIILDVGIEYGSAVVLSRTGTAYEQTAECFEKGPQRNDAFQQAVVPYREKLGAAQRELNGERALSSSYRDDLVCLIAMLTYQNANQLALGAVLFSKSFSAGSFLGIPVPDFAMMFTGALLFVLFLMIGILFPLYILESLFRVAIVCILFPLLIVAWVFDATSKYAVTAFKFVVASSVTIVIVCVILGICIAILELIYGGHMAVGQSIADAYFRGGEDGLKILKQVSSISSIGFLQLFFFAFVTIIVLMNAPGIAKNFTDVDTGSNFAGTANSLMKNSFNAAKGILNKVRK